MVTVRPGHATLIKGLCDMSVHCQPKATVAMLRVCDLGMRAGKIAVPYSGWVPCMAGRVAG